MNIFKYFVVVTLAFAAGWYSSRLYDADSTHSKKRPLLSYSPPSSASVQSQQAMPSSLVRGVVSMEEKQAVGEQSLVDARQRFYTLLDAAKYQQAMEVLHEVRQRDGALATSLRGELLNFLVALMEAEDAQAFTDLADAYLALVFDDVDALLLLAEFNQRTGYYFEALSVFQLAREYAYDAADKNKVHAAFARFISTVDQSLMAQNNRYLLSQIYMQADTVGLLSPSQQLRLAEIHFNAGDEYLSETVLARLLADASVGEAATALLAKIRSANSPVANDHTLGDERAVPLIKKGNQYVAVLQLDGYHDVRLLMDTGASMTTLSEHALARVGSSLNFRELGSRMFRTANGVAKGRVLQLDTVTLGSFTLSDARLAVLNFDIGDDVDGLLGMNVLGAFEFRIVDAAGEARLLLQPR